MATATNLTIRNHETGETITLARDVTTEHPAWVHEQCGTQGEVELQAMLDQISMADYEGQGRDECGIGVGE